MVGSRTATALVGLAASLVISAVVWWYFESFLLFLFVPFVPFLLRRREAAPPVRTCPQCGFESPDPTVNYCPRDGSELQE